MFEGYLHEYRKVMWKYVAAFLFSSTLEQDGGWCLCVWRKKNARPVHCRNLRGCKVFSGVLSPWGSLEGGAHSWRYELRWGSKTCWLWWLWQAMVFATSHLYPILQPVCVPSKVTIILHQSPLSQAVGWEGFIMASINSCVEKKMLHWSTNHDYHQCPKACDLWIDVWGRVTGMNSQWSFKLVMEICASSWADAFPDRLSHSMKHKKKKNQSNNLEGM